MLSNQKIGFMDNETLKIYFINQSNKLYSIKK